MKTTTKQIEQLKELIKIQCTDGNWNYDQYMRGMANGLKVALSVLDGKDPEFLEDIDIYLSDLKLLDKFNKSAIIVDDDRT